MTEPNPRSSDKSVGKTPNHKPNGQFAAGNKANPKGRPPKDQSPIEYIRAQLPKICPYDARQRTWLEALADAELRYALTDTSARADLLNRLVGKPKGEFTGNLTLRIVDDDDSNQ